MTTQFVSAGVVSSGAVVTSGDTLEVLSGGTANATNVSSGGIQQVDAGGLASATVISAGGTDLVFGSDTHDQVLAGGVETIGAGGVVSAVTGSGLFTADSGALNVLAGGTLFNAIVYSGGQLNVASGGTAAAFTLSGGVLNLSAGATANSFTVSSGGSANVLGTTLSNTTVETGGVETVSSGGIVTGASSSGLGNSVSGTVIVLSGGDFGHAVVYGGTFPGFLEISAGGTAHDFTVSGGGQVTLVTEDTTPCYCAGTLILTDRGEVEVERLAIGDNIITADGTARPIRWIGRRSYAGRFARGSHVLPICIKAGALDVDSPRRDLWVSPHHAMFLDGVLIEAIDLVNGVSVIQAERAERVDYFHIELDSHDIIVAE